MTNCLWRIFFVFVAAGLHAQEDSALQTAVKYRTRPDADWAEAARWLEIAASEGSEQAAELLADCIASGEGRVIDPVQVRHWRERSGARTDSPQIAGTPWQTWIDAAEVVEDKPTGLKREQVLADLQKFFYAARMAVEHVGPAEAGRAALMINGLLPDSEGAKNLRTATLETARTFLSQHAQLVGNQGGGMTGMNAHQYHVRKDATEALLLLRDVEKRLASAYLQSGRNEEAADLLQQLMASKEEPLLVELSARAFTELGREEEAAQMKAREKILRDEISVRLLETARQYESSGDLQGAYNVRRRAAEVQSGMSFLEIDFASSD